MILICHCCMGTKPFSVCFFSTAALRTNLTSQRKTKCTDAYSVARRQYDFLLLLVSSGRWVEDTE